MSNYIKEILTDRTQAKTFSHERLSCFIEKYNDATVLSTVYLKDQLLRLCEAYEVHFRRADTKKTLATSLMEAIRNKTSIPFTAPVDDRQFQVVNTVADESHGAVRITLRLTGTRLYIVSCKFVLCKIIFANTLAQFT